MLDMTTVNVLVLGTSETLLYANMRPETALVCAALYKSGQVMDLHCKARKAELRRKVYYGDSGRTAFLDHGGFTFGVKLAGSPVGK